MEDQQKESQVVVVAETAPSEASSMTSGSEEMRLMEMRIKLAEIEMQRQQLVVESQRLALEGASAHRGTTVTSGEEDRMLKFANLLKGVLSPMPTQESLVPGWFEDVEATLEAYNVPKEWRAGLVLPLLSERARALLTRLSSVERTQYDKLKSKILEGLRLSTAEYRHLFLQSRRSGKETWDQFAVRIENYLSYYLRSCNVKSMEELQQLMVVDRLKECLTPEARAHIILNGGEGLLKPSDLAKMAENFDESLKCKTNSSGNTVPNKHRETVSSKAKLDSSLRPNTSHAGARPKKGGCYGRHSPDHILKDCPQRKKEPKAQTNAVSVATVPEDNVLVARVAVPIADRKLSHEPADGSDKLHFNKLQEVQLKNSGSTFTAYVDSGAEISVIKRSSVSKYDTSGSTLKLIGAFGEVKTAELAYVPLRLVMSTTYVSSEQADPVFLCALVDRLAEGTTALITYDVYEQLRRTFDPSVTPNEGECVKDDTVVRDTLLTEVDDINSDEEDNGLVEEDDLAPRISSLQVVQSRNTERQGSRAEFIELQKNDPTLADAWDQAHEGTHGMTIIDGLLYHQDSINGHTCKQLVLPEEKRAEVLQLAHDIPWAGHLSQKKTLQRIKGSFYWPGISGEVKRYCQSCHGCQIKSPARWSDKAPITPIARPSVRFQVVNMDCIGPIDPPSSKEHKYALCVVDLCTRWPEVVCLRTLTAKAVCCALLEIFARLGVPEIICCDNGTNFTAKLTREFLERMGSTPRFSTPDHPQSNGLVERWNGTFKSMLFHVVEEYGRDWDKHVPFLLWAYREVPNVTTGESPFEMMYGRSPNGPLSILQKTWTEDWTVPNELNKPASEYLAELRHKINVADERARAAVAESQERSIRHYNLRTRDKQFSDGDQVIWFDDNNGDKLRPKWTGPATILERTRPYSYLIEFEDGNRKTVHANKLRPYYAKANTVGVIFDEDNDFGKVEWVPRRENGRQELTLTTDDLTHQQLEELRSVINKYKDVFGQTPGRCKIGYHSINVKTGAEPQKAYPYRIPMALRKEVEKQIHELLEWGLIYPVESKYAHPIVCVSKKDGRMRLCVDYRKLNAITEPDAFPMSQANEILCQVAGAKFITVIDMLRGYWQIPLEKNAEHCTAFVTHQGQYAWRVMPYGLRNSASTFQRVVNEVLLPHRDYACAYIDDVAIFSETWEDHIRHLGKVLNAVADAGLTINVTKCKFAQKQVHFLGHVVGSGTHAPDTGRIKAIEEIARPETKKDLRSFLGLCNYYRDYVPNFSGVVLPLTQLTCKRIPQKLPWTTEAEKAFCEVKRCLASASLLYAPDPGKGYLLATDASDYAVGACLSQLADDGKEHPIAFLSRKLSPTQTRWATIEREAFAIIWALQRLETWLFGAMITIITDHNPLKYLTLTTPHSARLTRWALALQKFNVTIVHKQGTLNANADALSRLTTATECST
ncbi:uncharacterized protein LOC135395659 [Ornithodoros turicata]|uniref:uncharacterized protein LOC135395659 n=1 Tax=Ornithodoros turicata TaxID=34597 RepID=UPI003139FCDF